MIPEAKNFSTYYLKREKFMCSLHQTREQKKLEHFFYKDFMCIKKCGITIKKEEEKLLSIFDRERERESVRILNVNFMRGHYLRA